MTQNSDQNSNSSQARGDGEADPLGKLQELISEAKNSSAGNRSASAAADKTLSSEDGAQAKMDKINRLKQQKAEEEKQLIAEQKELMKKIVAESPQTKKRAEAKQESRMQDDNASSEGYEIKQLSHIKIKKQN